MAAVQTECEQNCSVSWGSPGPRLQHDPLESSMMFMASSFDLQRGRFLQGEQSVLDCYSTASQEPGTRPVPLHYGILT